MLRVYECVYVFCVCVGKLFISWQLEAERAGKELDKTSPSMLHFQCPLTSKSFYYLPQRPSDSEAMNKLIHVNISALRMSTSHSSVALNIAHGASGGLVGHLGPKPGGQLTLVLCLHLALLRQRPP